MGRGMNIGWMLEEVPRQPQTLALGWLRRAAPRPCLPCLQVLNVTPAPGPPGVPPAEGRSQGSPAAARLLRGSAPRPPGCGQEPGSSPRRTGGRRARAGASRPGPVEAARAHASRGNDAAGPAALDPTAAASGRAARGLPPARAPRPARAREAKFGRGRGARTFPPAWQLSAGSPSAGPGRRPSALPDYLLWLFPQRRSLRGGHLELPDSSAAVAAASRTVGASGGGGRGSRILAHVPTASGTVELRPLEESGYKSASGDGARERRDALPGRGGAAAPARAVSGYVAWAACWNPGGVLGAGGRRERREEAVCAVVAVPRTGFTVGPRLS